jgi:electron transfer flavoprotein beta subunit
MDITVCIKQVPGTSEVKIDPETGVLQRNGIESKMNPYDLYALETGVRLKEKYQGTVTALTMGPPQARQILEEAFMMGSDEAILLSDSRFAGADVLATAYTLSQGIRQSGNFDLIICGKQTTDGDTAQVGAEIAEFLGLPHVTNVSAIREVSKTSIIVVMDLPSSLEEVEVQFPCLITVEKGIFPPRLPSYLKKKACRDRVIRRVSLEDLEDSDPNRYGLVGSPTQVARIFPPAVNNSHELWEGPAPELADRLLVRLQREKLA